MPYELDALSDDAVLAWMLDQVGQEMAGILGWDEPPALAPALFMTRRLLDVATIADATDENRVLAAARYAVWNLARRELVAAVNLRYPDGEAVDRATLYTHAAAEAKDAEAALGAVVTIAPTPVLRRTAVRRRSPFADPLGASRGWRKP